MYYFLCLVVVVAFVVVDVEILSMDKMRFGQAVPVGSRLRMVTKLHEIANLRGICKASIAFKIEIEGQRKPALEGIATFLYYFK